MTGPAIRSASEEARLPRGPTATTGTPDYAGRSLPNVGATLLRSRDSPASALDSVGPGLEASVDPTGGDRPEGPVVIFLVDGLGWLAFRRAVEGAREGRPSAVGAWGGSARPITTVFPSTTTSALTSLSTGLPPSRHGIVGHRQYLPRFGVVADMLRMSPAESAGTDGLAGPDFEPSELTGIPTVFERGLRTTVISRDRFEGTGFTRLLYAGAEYRPYATASDLAFTLARVLDRTDPPEAVLVYWDELDTVQHVHGPEQYLVDLELDRIHHLLRSATGRIAPERLRSVALWLTADHGQVPAPDPQNLRIEQHPELVRELLHAPAGDRRAGYFAVRPGRSEGFREAIAPLLPAATVHRPMAAALAAGWFGPPPFHPEIEARTGTDLVLPPPPVGLTYRPPGGGVRHRPTHGAHGGLEREELWVPLLVGPLAELAGWP